MRGRHAALVGARRARAALLAGLLLMVATAPGLAAVRIDLNRQWQFRADPAASGVAAGWNAAVPPDTETVTLPHTWNIGRLHDYRGLAWYFLRFGPPPHPASTHMELHFGATFYNARVWLNGVELGSHEGGFTEYAFDVSSALRDTNVLAVQIDNRPGMATIPGVAARGGPAARYDWWTYGGMVRGVWLTSSGDAWVGRQRIRTEQNASSAVVRDLISLRAPGQQRSLTLHVTAFGPDNRVVGEETRTISIAGAKDVEVSLPVARPRLWSIDQPNLYRMVVEVRHGAHILDTDAATFGIRSIEIRDLHLLINGERVRLTGIARHEDSPWEGLAETPGTIRHDYDDMEALHTTMTRPVHYPQNPLVLDYADRHGILLIPEIPVWQFSEAQLSDPRVLELARQQLREVIEQSANHPSIFGWSVANESATATPGGIAYFRALRAFIHELDPRPVSFADDNLPKLQRAEQSAANDADFLMMNQYFGSWHGPADALVPALERVHALFPQKMVIISEMGFAGIFAHDAAAADVARIRTMREQMPVLAAQDWIAGAILWCYQDYKSPRNLWPGETEGFVEHGLVDEWRQRKPSYVVWKELNVSARIAAHWTGPAAALPQGFELQLTPNTEHDLPYRPLHDYRLSWIVTDAKGRTVTSGQRQFPELTEAIHVAGSLSDPVSLAGAGSTGADGLDRPSAPESNGPSYHLRATLSNPIGLIAGQTQLEWPPMAPVSERR